MRVVLCVFVVALVASSTAAAATVDPRAPRQQHTAAADEAREARSCCAAATSRPGWKLDPPAKPNPPCTAGPDESKLVQTAKADPSFTWKDGVTNIGSEVDIFSTPAEARTRLARVDARAPRRRACCRARAPERGRRRTCGLSRRRRSRRRRVPNAACTTASCSASATAESANLVIDVVALGRGAVTVVLHTLTVRSAAARLDARRADGSAGRAAERRGRNHRLTGHSLA